MYEAKYTVMKNASDIFIVMKLDLDNFKAVKTIFQSPD